MPTPAQLRNIWLLSDTVLYPEAVAFLLRLLRDEDCKPLPASQVHGLLSIAEVGKYALLRAFITHQYTRNWPPRQRDIKTFYLALEESLTTMQKRLRGDFHLLAGTKKAEPQITQEEEALMALLAREFIQHILAENALQASLGENERRPSASAQRTGSAGARDARQQFRGNRG